jgi:hypothetical protein
MAVEAAVLSAQGVTHVTMKSTVAARMGQLIGFDGTDWVLADADARIPAQFIALETVAAGALVTVAVSGTLSDADAPFTAGADQYLSATAGAMGAIPAISTTLTIVQRVGKAVSTSEIAFDLSRKGPDRLRATAAVDPASGNTDTVQDLAVTVTGVLATDYVTAKPLALAQGVIFNGAAVPTTDTVTVGIANASAGTVNGASVSWTFLVERP